MKVKRLWIALFAVLLCIGSVALVNAQRTHSSSVGSTDPTCTSSIPCIEYDNTSAGPGIKGLSVGGNGLIGVTEFKSTSASNGKAGVFGNDVSTTGIFSTGVTGKSVHGNGVFGISQGSFASGVFGQNSGGGIGVAGRITKSGQAAVLADAGSTGSIAVLASSLKGIGANIIGGAVTISEDLPALSVVENGTGADLIDACASQNPCDLNHSVFEVDAFGDINTDGGLDVGAGVFGSNGGGDVNITGVYRKLGFCVAGCPAATAVAAGRAVTTYASMVSQPTVEDFGEAQLASGHAYVRINPDFGNVIEQRSKYLVVITPEGDSRGLYVANKSPAGFTVRENQGGRSTLMFSYRIVATPLGSHEARLPMVTVPRIRTRGVLEPRSWLPR